MSNKRIILIIGILIIIVGVFGYLNHEKIKDKKEIHENASLIVTDGEREIILDFEEIKSLGEKEFKADLKASGKEPVEHLYKGVALKKLIEKSEISLDNKSRVIVRSIDGYTVALGIEEVLEDENIYLTYKLDGEMIKSREEGGNGPYQVIIRKDPFSQRWSKYVVEIEIE